jgi:hypothetical protein
MWARGNLKLYLWRSNFCVEPLHTPLTWGTGVGRSAHRLTTAVIHAPLPQSRSAARSVARRFVRANL